MGHKIKMMWKKDLKFNKIMDCLSLVPNNDTQFTMIKSSPGALAPYLRHLYLKVFLQIFRCVLTFTIKTNVT